MRDMRLVALPFDFDLTFITSDDALTHHGKTSWTRELLILPIGAFSEDSIASTYLDICNLMQYALTAEKWDYLLQHMFLLPQHIHGNEDTHANHLGLAMYFLFDANEEALNSSVRFEIRTSLPSGVTSPKYRFTQSPPPLHHPQQFPSIAYGPCSIQDQVDPSSTAMDSMHGSHISRTIGDLVILQPT